MSRCWAGPDRKGEYHRKARPKPLTPAWVAAKAARASLRKGFPVQPRDKQGFIIRTEDGHTVCYDPGVIDRYLWVQSNPDTD